MKKRLLSLLLVACMLVYVVPTVGYATGAPEDTTTGGYYETYTAIGDSICAGFSQADYKYINGFDMTENIYDSPEFCYARLVGNALGSEVYNLGKPGCDTNELLDILNNEENGFYDVYQDCIGSSDLITLEIGSNDLLMAVVDALLVCVYGESSGMTHQQAMAVVEPLLTGDFPGIVKVLKSLTGSSLTDEQTQALMALFSDDSLNAILQQAYATFCENFPHRRREAQGNQPEFRDRDSQLLQSIPIRKPELGQLQIQHRQYHRNVHPGDERLCAAVQLGRRLSVCGYFGHGDKDHRSASLRGRPCADRGQDRRRTYQHRHGGGENGRDHLARRF